MNKIEDSPLSILYVSHGGGPLPLLGDESHREMVANLRQVTAQIARPAAIIVISAHWEAGKATITAGANPSLIYDYYGFPKQSYEIQYPVSGEPALARKVLALLKDKGIDAELDDQRGFDHGLFVPLKIMYPEADIPCIQLSLVDSLNPVEHIKLGEALAGLGKENLGKVAVDEHFAMIPGALEEAIRRDLEQGLKPLCVVATLGTTGSTAIDPLKPIGEICEKYGIWLHVDAALAGTALILPEKRRMAEGIEKADTFVFNPHKWMFTNFDCSAYFVKDKEALIRTFEILPEYLKTREAERVNNYRDWGIPLGRRFRALKLWFVIRTYGVKGLQEKIRRHLQLAEYFVKKIEASADFELLAPVPLNTICFRYNTVGRSYSTKELNQLNADLLERVNDSGKAFLTHTKLNDIYTIRMVIGQTQVEKRHVDAAWDLIVAEAKRRR